MTWSLTELWLYAGDLSSAGVWESGSKGKFDSTLWFIFFLGNRILYMKEKREKTNMAQVNHTETWLDPSLYLKKLGELRV